MILRVFCKLVLTFPFSLFLFLLVVSRVCITATAILMKELLAKLEPTKKSNLVDFGDCFDKNKGASCVIVDWCVVGCWWRWDSTTTLNVCLFQFTSDMSSSSSVSWDPNFCKYCLLLLLSLDLARNFFYYSFVKRLRGFDDY